MKVPGLDKVISKRDLGGLYSLFELQQFHVHSSFVHPIWSFWSAVVHLEGDGILIFAVRVLGRFDASLRSAMMRDE